MCGYFREVRSGFFGDIIGVKIWVELVNGVLTCYDSPFGGTVVSTIECKSIADIEEIVFDKLEIAIEAIKISLLNPDPNLPNTELIWGWADDRAKFKGLWRKALITNHGSGLVDEHTFQSLTEVGMLFFHLL